jgi:hypothetical protein
MARKTTSGSGTPLSEGQRAYEARRAAKAGMTLDRWLEQKRRAEEAEAAARAKIARPEPPKKKGFIARLIDRAHKPLS